MYRYKNRQIKTRRITVRLTEEEYQHLTSQSEGCGIGNADYVRRMIMQEPVLKVKVREELGDLRTELHHVGNNLNQIAHGINGSYYRMPELVPRIERAVTDVRAVLKQIMLALGG